MSITESDSSLPANGQCSLSRRLRIADCREFVRLYYGLKRYEITSHCRKRRLAWPRHIAMVLARRLTAASLPAIGIQFGGRDHTTVMFALRRAAQHEAAKNEFASDLLILTQRLTAWRDFQVAEITRKPGKVNEFGGILPCAKDVTSPNRAARDETLDQIMAKSRAITARIVNGEGRIP